MKDIQDVYKAGEAKQQQLKDLGLPLFLHSIPRPIRDP